jgi:Uma2 family endonuclease
MSHTLVEAPLDYSIIQGMEDARLSVEEAVKHLVTEDDEPVDNLFSEKQQRLLTRSLYSSWTPPPAPASPEQKRVFLAAANVGVYFALRRPPLVPDFFLSLDVQVADDWYAKQHRSYMFWEFGKAPELVLEIVSNQEGDELGRKLVGYAQIGVLYYVVYDPEQNLSEEVLQSFVLRDGEYQRLLNQFYPRLGLGLTMWQGEFEGKTDTWLRWCDAQGQLIATGEERAVQAEAEVAALREELARLRQQLSP